jgi:hypothetical protein
LRPQRARRRRRRWRATTALRRSPRWGWCRTRSVASSSASNRCASFHTQAGLVVQGCTHGFFSLLRSPLPAPARAERGLSGVRWLAARTLPRPSTHSRVSSSDATAGPSSGRGSGDTPPAVSPWLTAPTPLLLQALFAGPAFSQCTACSPCVVNQWRRDWQGFVLKVRLAPHAPHTALLSLPIDQKRTIRTGVATCRSSKERIVM